VATLGDVNHSAAYEIVTATNAERLKEPGAGEVLAGLPRNYSLRRGAARPPPFDYGASPFFRRSGAAAAGEPKTVADAPAAVD
jgi:hypothetical protein